MGHPAVPWVILVYTCLIIILNAYTLVHKLHTKLSFKSLVKKVQDIYGYLCAVVVLKYITANCINQLNTGHHELVTKLTPVHSSLTSQSFLAAPGSLAAALGSLTAQSVKYRPETPSSSSATAQWIVVCAPCVGFLKKSEETIHRRILKKKCFGSQFQIAVSTAPG